MSMLAYNYNLIREQMHGIWLPNSTKSFSKKII